MNSLPERIFQLIKPVVLMNINVRVCLYLPIIIMGSLICDLYPLPDSYFNYKDNVFNRGFMKNSYFWAFFAILPFMLITTYLYNIGNILYTILSGLRASLIIVICHYLFNHQFLGIEALYSHCDEYADTLKSETECVAKGYSWTSFEISGHTFRLFYCSLVMLEECKLYQIWESFDNGLHAGPESANVFLNGLTDKEYATVKRTMKLFGLTKVLIVIIGVVIILLDVAILTTLLYFHQLDEKLIGGIVAIVFWFFQYKLVISKILESNVQKYCDQTITADKMCRQNNDIKIDKHFWEKKKIPYSERFVPPCFSPFSYFSFEF